MCQQLVLCAIVLQFGSHCARCRRSAQTCLPSAVCSRSRSPCFSCTARLGGLTFSVDVSRYRAVSVAVLLLVRCLWSRSLGRQAHAMAHGICSCGRHPSLILVRGRARAAQLPELRSGLQAKTRVSAAAIGSSNAPAPSSSIGCSRGARSSGHIAGTGRSLHL